MSTPAPVPDMTKLYAKFQAWCAREGYPTAFVANACDLQGQRVHADPRTHAAWWWAFLAGRAAGMQEAAEIAEGQTQEYEPYTGRPLNLASQCALAIRGGITSGLPDSSTDKTLPSASEPRTTICDPKLDPKLSAVLRKFAAGGTPRCSKAQFEQLWRLAPGVFQLESRHGADLSGGYVLTSLQQGDAAKDAAKRLLA